VQGDYLENNLGDFAGTLTSYRKALELRKQIGSASRDWNDRLALAQGYRLVAHQLWANGDPRAARDPIARAIAVSETLDKEHPNNLKILDELGFDYEVSGRIGYPGESDAKQKILQDYRRGLAIGEASLKLKPNDIQLLHGYATGLSDVGTMLESTNAQDALGYYQKSLEIDRKLTQLSTDLRYRRGVAIAYGSIASVYDDLGDYPHAVENDLKDLAIYQDLAATDPKNALLRQGLAISYLNAATACVRVGQVAKALDYSNRGLQIMGPLASSGPRNAFQQIVLAAMLIGRGTILAAAHQPEAAKKEIEHGRAVYESLYKAGNVSQVYVAASDVKLGETVAATGHDQDAADYFHQALTVLEPLIAAAPPDLDALYAAADAYSGLGALSAKAARRPGLSTQQRRSSGTEARSWYLLSRNTWQRIDHPNHTAPNSFHVGDPAIVASQLKSAENLLASLH
jgi:tetratricopeptide (TPR) repeat protein